MLKVFYKEYGYNIKIMINYICNVSMTNIINKKLLKTEKVQSIVSIQ